MIPCPSCGSQLRFDITSQQMRCDRCDNLFSPEQFDEKHNDAEETQYFDACVLTCPSCGGELITTDETDAVGFCPYCGGESLLFDRVCRSWEPDAVVPFKMTKEQCKQAYLKEVRRHPLVSKKYRDPKMVDRFLGIYMPYFSYRIEEKGTALIEAGTDEKRDGDYLYKNVFQINAESNCVFEGYEHDAANAFDNRISDRLLPYDKREAKPFYPGYLSGFYADIGDVDSQTYEDDAIRLLTGFRTIKLRSFVRKQIGTTPPAAKLGLGMKEGVLNSIEQVDLPLRFADVRRVLYPVWFMSYRDGNTLTYATVNGQTGEVVADLPISPLRILLLCLALSAVSFAALLFLPSIKPFLAAFIVTILYALGSFYIGNVFHDLTKAYPEHEAFIDRFGKFGPIRLIRTLLKKYSDWVLNIQQRKKRSQSASNAIGILMAFGLLLALGVLALGLTLLCVFLYIIFAEAVTVGFAQKMLGYSYCLVLVALMLIKAYRFIAVQIRLARRKPPQFNKKGADQSAS